MGARYYDPAVGRFTQVNPSGCAQSVNLYWYVSGDPANSTDPTGLLDIGELTRCLEAEGVDVGVAQDCAECAAGIAALVGAVAHGMHPHWSHDTGEACTKCFAQAWDPFSKCWKEAGGFSIPWWLVPGSLPPDLEDEYESGGGAEWFAFRWLLR